MRAKLNRYKACMPLKAITYALKLKQTRGDCDLPIGDLYPYEQVSQLLLFPTRYGKQIKHKDNCPESDCRVNNKVRNSDNKSEKSDDPCINNKIILSKRKVQSGYRSSMLSNASNASNDEEFSIDSP